MNTRWKKLLVKIIVWLVVEILLTILGIDDLADYSEFIGEKKNILVISSGWHSRFAQRELLVQIFRSKQGR